MKRILVLMMVIGLIFGSIATADAKKKKKAPKKVERVVESKYEAPAIGAPSGVGVCFRPTNSCGDIATGGEESWVKLEVIDATGTATAFTLGQDTDPDTPGTETTFGDFCGTTGDETIQIQPGLPLVVFPWAFGDVVCPGAFGTQGTIKATLSNLP